MDQNPNTPPPNQNQNQPPMLGFIPYCGEFTSLLNQGNMSPTIPNQPQFVQTASPPIPFQHIHQSFDPRAGTFIATFPQFQQNQQNPQTQTQQTQHTQSYEHGGGSYSGSIPMFSTQRPSLEPINEPQVEASQPTKKKNGSKKKKGTSEPQG